MQCHRRQEPNRAELAWSSLGARALRCNLAWSSLGGMPRSAERPRSAAIGGQATRERGREAGLIAGSRARLRDAHAEEASLPYGGRRGAPTTRRCAAAARVRDVPRPRLENPICAPAWLGLMRSPWGVPERPCSSMWRRAHPWRRAGGAESRIYGIRNQELYIKPSWSSKRRDAAAERGRVKVTGPGPPRDADRATRVSREIRSCEYSILSRVRAPRRAWRTCAATLVPRDADLPA